ncbi:FimV/HubP family polar landmark protein, partial [Shewanella sp. 10N.286.55.A9]|uniref:FimV/HubP family polar landmark protein n=1 Tax=Shewanella sp. 10N.286.55.A9 TaxID=3229720 RepID=UPI00354C62F9
MIFRTSYFVGIMACALAVVSASHIIEPAHAETLRITGPNGEVSSAPTRQYGPTTSSDTFWSIAQKVRPNQDISVYQVMAALFDANPHAFSSNNYNSLERGMTLLVPSADVMAQISRADAKTRAENNDKRLPNANPRTTTAATIPATNNQAATNIAPSAQKPLQIVAQTQQPTAEELAKQAAEEVQPQIDELTVKLEDEQTKVLSLTDELARSEDMLMVKDADNTALKAKIQELTLQLSAMQEDFQLLTEKHQALEASHQQLIEQNNKPEVLEEPTDFWRSISDNMILLAVLAALPLIVIFLIIFWLMRRKSKAATEPENVTAPVAEQAVTEVQPEVDDIENLAIHLDDDEAGADNIDDLLDLDSAATEELSLDDSSDADMYITEDAETTEEEAEGTSLDDLWAEAMEEQEEDLQPLEADEDDLDSLLEGLDTPAEEAVSESVADEDDLDSLLAGLDEPETRSDEAISETEEAIDPQDDIDSLLAGFDVPEGDVASEPDAEKAADTDPQDDIDSL